MQCFVDFGFPSPARGRDQAGPAVDADQVAASLPDLLNSCFVCGCCYTFAAAAADSCLDCFAFSPPCKAAFEEKVQEAVKDGFLSLFHVLSRYRAVLRQARIEQDARKAAAEDGTTFVFFIVFPLQSKAC